MRTQWHWHLIRVFPRPWAKSALIRAPGPVIRPLNAPFRRPGGPGPHRVWTLAPPRGVLLVTRYLRPRGQRAVSFPWIMTAGEGHVYTASTAGTSEESLILTTSSSNGLSIRANRLNRMRLKISCPIKMTAAPKISTRITTRSPSVRSVSGARPSRRYASHRTNPTRHTQLWLVRKGRHRRTIGRIGRRET